MVTASTAPGKKRRGKAMMVDVVSQVEVGVDVYVEASEVNTAWCYKSSLLIVHSREIQCSSFFRVTLCVLIITV